MGIFDFLKKNKNIINNNGLNESYYDNGKGKIQERFFKKEGKMDGLFERFEQYESFILERINYKNGKKHGRNESYKYQQGFGTGYETVLYFVQNYNEGNPTLYRETYDLKGVLKTLNLEDGNKLWFNSKGVLKTYDEILSDIKKNIDSNEKTIRGSEKWDKDLEQKKVEGSYDNFMKSAKENNNMFYFLYTEQKKMLEIAKKETTKKVKPFLINNFAFIEDNDIISITPDCFKPISLTQIEMDKLSTEDYELELKKQRPKFLEDF